MLHNCNVFEHIIVIYRFVIRKTWPLHVCSVFFWPPLEWPGLLAGAAVQVLWLWPAPSLRRRCFGVSGELVVHRRKGIPWEFHPYLWDLWEDHQDPESKLWPLWGSRLSFLVDPLELPSHLFGSKTIWEGLVRFRFCQVRKTSVGARSNRRSTLVMTSWRIRQHPGSCWCWELQRQPADCWWGKYGKSWNIKKCLKCIWLFLTFPNLMAELVACRLRPCRSSEEDSTECHLLDADLDLIFILFSWASSCGLKHPKAGCLKYDRDSNFCKIFWGNSENQDETKPKTTLNKLVNSV